LFVKCDFENFMQTKGGKMRKNPEKSVKTAKNGGIQKDAATDRSVRTERVRRWMQAR
jgi:hypothetical protein